MKRRIMIAIVVLIVCLLCGCSGAGKTNQGPSDTILEEALRSSLAEYAPQQELTDFEVETSLTQETSYTATVKALTKSRYAEFPAIGAWTVTMSSPIPQWMKWPRSFRNVIVISILMNSRFVQMCLRRENVLPAVV